jgi:hypothetical protein
MNYKTIATNLYSTADIVYDYIKNDLGLSPTIESPINNRIEYRPLFQANQKDFHILCIDVSETIDIDNMTKWRFIDTCRRDCHPVLFYIALPSLNYYPFSKELKQAKSVGIGIIEVDNQSKCCTIMSSALALHLCGLRKFNKRAFPRKYRQCINDGEETFRNGNPTKACHDIYSEMEDLTRKLAMHIHNRGDFITRMKNPRRLSRKMSWAKVLEAIRDNVNRDPHSRYEKLTTPLLDKINGIIPDRHETGHKPSSRAALKNRDTQLRTRMEHAVDIFEEFINATKSLRL